jgi:hypothetical protein
MNKDLNNVNNDDLNNLNKVLHHRPLLHNEILDSCTSSILLEIISFEHLLLTSGSEIHYYTTISFHIYIQLIETCYAASDLLF